MKIITDNSEHFLLDEESGRSFNVRKLSPISNSFFDYQQGKTVIANYELDENGYIFYIEKETTSCIETQHKYGYALNNGEVTIKPIYDSLMFYKDDCFFASINAYYQDSSGSTFYSKVYGVIDKYSVPRVNIPSKSIFENLHCYAYMRRHNYDLVSPFSYGFAVFLKEGKMGVISSQLKEVIPAEYDAINNNNWFQKIFTFNTYDNEYRGVIRLGKIADGSIQTRYAIVRGLNVVNILDNVDSISCLNLGFGYIARKGRYYAFYNIDGEQLLPFSFTNILDIAENIIRCKKEKNETLYHVNNGGIVAQTESSFEFIDGSYSMPNQCGVVACIKKNGRYLLVDQDFKNVAEVKLPQAFKGTVIPYTYGDGVVGIEEQKNCYYSRYFVDLNGLPIFSFKDKGIDIMSFKSGFVSGKAHVAIYAINSGFRNLDGYYNAIISLSGDIISQKWVDCDIRERSDSDMNNIDILDAFEGDPSAYWNID